MNNQKITPQEIADYAMEHLKELMADNGEVRIENIVKNNDQVLTSICFTPTGCNIGPTVYAEDFTEHKTVKLAVDEIARVIKKHLVHEDVDLNHIFQKEYLKENLRIRLVNLKKNEQRLRTIPHRIVLGDLAAYPVINVEANGISGVVPIHENHLLNIEMSQDEILDTAIENSGKEMVSTGLDKYLEEHGSPRVPELSAIKIITNRDNNYGAGCILANLDKFGKDYTILPSSIHEVIIMGEGCTEEMFYGLNEMVQEVNALCVADSEILSDHAYHVMNEQLVREVA